MRVDAGGGGFVQGRWPRVQRDARVTDEYRAIVVWSGIDDGDAIAFVQSAGRVRGEAVDYARCGIARCLTTTRQRHERFG